MLSGKPCLAPYRPVESLAAGRYSRTVKTPVSADGPMFQTVRIVWPGSHPERRLLWPEEFPEGGCNDPTDGGNHRQTHRVYAFREGPAGAEAMGLALADPPAVSAAQNAGQ